MPFRFRSRLPFAYPGGLLLCALLVLGAAGCMGTKTLHGGPLPGSVRIVSALSAGSAHVASGEVTLRRDGIVRTVPLLPTEGGFAAEVGELPAGVWDLTLSYFDESGNVTHTGESQVSVTSGASVVAHVTARPADAKLELIVDLSGFPERERTGKVRITYHTGSTQTLSPAEAPYTFTGSRMLAPGDYEFSVGLYEDDFYVADRIYVSPWTPVRLSAGQTLQVVWTAPLGAAGVEVELVELPPTPAGVACEARADGVWIVWETSDPAGAETVRIYRRDGEFEAFEKEGEVEWASGAWRLEESESWSEATPPVRAQVSSVDSGGRESYRSAPVQVHPCGA